MKQCPWCGKEYPDDASVCGIDGYALDARVSGDTATTPEPMESTPARAWSLEGQNQEAESQPDEDGFRHLGDCDNLEADRFLKKYLADGIRFQINLIEKKVLTDRGYRKTGTIQIFVHRDDFDKAWKIFTADWKV